MPLLKKNGCGARLSIISVRAVALFCLLGTSAYSIDSFTVNSTANSWDTNRGDGICADASGMCSFGAAIDEATASGVHTIILAVPYVEGGGQITEMSIISSMGTEIRGPVDLFDNCVFRGITMGDYSALCLYGSNNHVEQCNLSHSGGVGISGLYIYGNDNIIGGDAGRRNILKGVDVEGERNIIQSNYIGVLADGTTPGANSWGVIVSGDNNLIGGASASQGNLINNSQVGVQLVSVGSSCHNNTVQYNVIGLNSAGEVAGNYYGVLFEAAQNNTVANNIISGNTAWGIEMDSTSGGNHIYGNRIGVDALGENARRNDGGIKISGYNNVIGRETEAQEGNIISGNGWGIWIEGSSAINNAIRGNYIGVSASGRTVISNSSFGVFVREAPGTIIGGAPSGWARNIISGNGHAVSINGTNATGCVVQSNFIGLDAFGGVVLGNRGDGINIDLASDTVIGCGPADNDSGLGNVIAGNSSGILIARGSGNHFISRNLIGTLANGFTASSNRLDGISVFDCPNVKIGDAVTGGNVVFGSVLSGVRISGSNSANVIVEANRIMGGERFGISVNAAPGVIVGGQRPAGLLWGNGPIIFGRQNVIGGHSYASIYIHNSARARVQGNLIGADLPFLVLPGEGSGVELEECLDAVLGGAAPGMGNVVVAQNYGIRVFDSPGTVIRGNSIGGMASHMSSAMGNSYDGLVLMMASNVVVGGSAPGEGNLFVNNGQKGISVGWCSECAIEGNDVGVGPDGETPAGNGGGISLINSSRITIGGSTAASGNRVFYNRGDGIGIMGGTNIVQWNIIGSNAWNGISISGDGNEVYENTVGLTANGTIPAGNGFNGIMVFGISNRIGAVSGLGNTVAANGGDGIRLFDGTTVFGNKIGVSQALLPFGNGLNGISLGGSGNAIGAWDIGAGNTIAFNRGEGVNISSSNNSIIANAIYQNSNNAVRISGKGAGITIVGNSMYTNGALGINWDPAPPYTNDMPDLDGIPNMPTSVISDSVYVRGVLLGVAHAVYRLDYYGNDVCDPSGYGEGQYYYGSSNITCDVNGYVSFMYSIPPSAAGRNNVTVTATEPDGSTSEFSACTNPPIAPPGSAHMLCLGTNGVVIVDGDITPSTGDGTDFGFAALSGGVVLHAFTITNSGTSDLIISGAMTIGASATDFSVLAFPAKVSPGGHSNLVVRFDPAAAGLRTATIILTNNDVTSNPYDFTVQGVGGVPGVTNYAIGVSASPPAGGVVSGGGPYASGSSRTVTATANSGYTFASWIEGGTIVSTAASYTFTLSGNRTLVANFTANVSGIAITNPGAQQGIVGVMFTLPLAIVPSSNLIVSVNGLPSGLRYSPAQKVISGVPTAAVTNKTVTISARNKAGNVATQVFTMTVDPLRTWAWGTFNGWYRAGGDSVGVANMTVTKLGKITGKYSAGGTNYTFSAASYTNASSFEAGLRVVGIAKGVKTTVPVVLVVNSLVVAGGPTSLSKVEGRVNGVVGGAAPLVLYRDVWNDPDMKAATNLDGYYTATLPGDGRCGSGYLAFTLKKGSIKTSGKLADGNAVSLSSTVLVDESNRSFSVLYSAPTSYKGGCFFGMPEFLRPGAGAHVVVHPLEGEAFIWNNLAPEATGTHGEGFSRDVGLVGGWYDKLGNLRDYYANMTLTVGTSNDVPEIIVGTTRHSSAWWNPGGQPLMLLTNSLGVLTGITASRVGTPVKVVSGWDYESASNTVGLTFGLTRATGIFKGSFKAWFDYATTHTAKSILVEGILTPEREDVNDGIEGRGFFLWPDKATYLNSLGMPVTYSYNWSCDFLLFATP